ncbi:MAG: DUF4402 domain-containing protein [Deferrisomatales bacterium]|nr:DUF4402 domain-containing protein [Deferrisomatales bacterium]
MRHPAPHSAALAAGVAILLAPAAQAATGAAPVHVTIVQPLQMSTTQVMEFGTIAPPSEGTQTFRLDALSATLEPGPGTGTASGEAFLAEFAVTGDPDRALDVQAEVTQDFADPALSLGNLQVGGADAFDSGGQATVRIGGTLSVAAGATPATHGDAVITVTVNYP